MLYGFDESCEIPEICTADQEPAQYFLLVYNTCTRRMEKVAVSKAVFEAYRRTGWGIENNDTSFFCHEIQQTSMSQNDEVSIESLRESLDPETDVAVIFESSFARELLHDAICKLTPEEQELIFCIFFRGMSNAEYGRRTGVSGQWIGQKKQKILKKLKKILKKDFRF